MVAPTESNQVSLWLCSSVVLFLCLLRLYLRRWRRLRFTRGDHWIMVAMAFTIIRMVCGYYVVANGTPYSVADELGMVPHDSTAEREQQLELAGKLDVLLRGVLVCIYWSLKMAVLDLAELLVHSVVRKSTVIYGYYLILALTFVAAIASIFVDCRPLRLNWQIRPNPGYCVQGISWLYTYEIGNICTDAMLLILPFPVLCSARIHLWKHLRLLAVFSLGLVLCAVSIARVVQGLKQERVQENRILYGAIETVVASVVATTPTLYILLRPQSPRQSPNVPRSRHELSVSFSSEGLPRKSTWSSRMSRSRPRSFGPAASIWTEVSHSGHSGGGAGEGDDGTVRAIRVHLELDQSSGHIDDAVGDTGDIGRQVRVNDSSV